MFFFIAIAGGSDDTDESRYREEDRGRSVVS